MNKIRAIMYFIGYGAVMKSSDFDVWKEMTNLLNDIYQCRNLNHRGSELYEWQNAVIDRIMPLKSVYYMKFLGALTQYMEYVKTGLHRLDALHEYSQTLLCRDEGQKFMF